MCVCVCVCVAELELVKRIGNIASKNIVHRSYIGMGYYDCVTPPVIKRNVLENPGWLVYTITYHYVSQASHIFRVCASMESRVPRRIFLPFSPAYFPYAHAHTWKIRLARETYYTCNHLHTYSIHFIMHF